MFQKNLETKVVCIQSGGIYMQNLGCTLSGKVESFASTLKFFWLDHASTYKKSYTLTFC